MATGENQGTAPANDYWTLFNKQNGGYSGFVTPDQSANSLDFVVDKVATGVGDRPDVTDPNRVRNNLQPANTLFRGELNTNYQTTQWGPTLPGVPDGGMSSQYQRRRGQFYTVEAMWEPVADKWSRERIISLQAALAGTGLLTGATAGTWDSASASAFEKVLKYANDTDQGYKTAIVELAGLPAGTVADALSDDAASSRQAALDAAKARVSYTGNTYLAPDADNVRTNIRNMITQTVGRGYIDEDWVESMTQQFMSDYRAQHEQSERLARERYETQQTKELAANTGLSVKKVANLAGEDVPFGVTAEEAEVDVEGNLTTALEEKLDPIAGSIEERDRAENANRSVFNVFSGFGAMTGGQ